MLSDPELISYLGSYTWIKNFLIIVPLWSLVWMIGPLLSMI